MATPHPTPTSPPPSSPSSSGSERRSEDGWKPNNGASAGGASASGGEVVLDEESKRKEFEEWNQQKDNQLNFSRVMYCMGSIARIDNTIQNYYLNPFLLDVIGLKPSLTGNVLLIKQICDALTDPFIGYLSDNARTRFGRRKPFIYLASPVLWCMWILLWLQITKLENSQLALFFYYLLVLLVYNIASSTQAVPYRALMQDIAPTYGIRTRIVALYEMTAQVAFMVTSLVHGVLIESFYYPNTETVDYQFGYIVSALVFAPFIAFTRVFTSQFVEELPPPPPEEEEDDDVDYDVDEAKPFNQTPSQPTTNKRNRTCFQAVSEFASIWWSAVQFKDFTLLAVGWMLSNVVLALVTSNLVLYVKYYFRKPGMGKIVVLVLQMGIALSLPVWALVIRKIGKKNSLFLGNAVVACFFLGFFFLGQDQLMVFLVCLPIAGCAAGSLYICLTSMQPDCVEAYFNKTGKRHEAVLYSIYLLGGKIGSAVALALSSYALGATGYVSGADDPNGTVVQNNATLLAFRIILFLAPLGIMSVLCFLVWFIKDYKKDFSTDRATLTGDIVSERVGSKHHSQSMSHMSSHSPHTTAPRGSSQNMDEERASESKGPKVRWADQEI